MSKSITLVELIIALVVLSIVVLAFASIDIFSRGQVLSTDKRIRVQNEVGLTLEHMARNISEGVGTFELPAVDPDLTIGSDIAIKVYYDSNDNFRRDAGDEKLAYRYDADKHEVLFYATCPGDDCTGITPEMISDRISGFEAGPHDFFRNVVVVQVSACYWPNEIDGNGHSVPCGSDDNPEISMRTRILMPATPSS